MGPKSKIISDLKRLHELVWEHGSHSIALSMPQLALPTSMHPSGLLNESTRIEINQALEELAKTNEKMTYLDWAASIPNDFYTNPAHPFWSDNIHLSERGYAQMGRLIFDMAQA